MLLSTSPRGGDWLNRLLTRFGLVSLGVSCEPCRHSTSNLSGKPGLNNPQGPLFHLAPDFVGKMFGLIVPPRVHFQESLGAVGPK
jgi:hypothetical protein